MLTGKFYIIEKTKATIQGRKSNSLDLQCLIFAVKQLQDDLDRVGVETMPPPVPPPATPSPVAAGPPRESHDIRARPETKATGSTPVAG